VFYHLKAGTTRFIYDVLFLCSPEIQRESEIDFECHRSGNLRVLKFQLKNVTETAKHELNSRLILTTYFIYFILVLFKVKISLLQAMEAHRVAGG
jgi:hypothetical protein